jgi:hypothetical protein
LPFVRRLGGAAGREQSRSIRPARQCTPSRSLWLPLFD